MDDADDHTVRLTCSNLLREIRLLEKLFGQRMDGIEKAVTVAHDDLVRFPTEVQEAIGHLEKLMCVRLTTIDQRFNVDSERFTSVQTQFVERDTRTEETRRDSKVAVDAALQAAKEAVGKQQEASDKAIAKSELSTSRQIEQINILISSNNNSVDDKIDDLKHRLARIEGQDLGQKTAKTTQETSNMNLVSIIGLVIGSLIGIGGLLAGFWSRGG